MTQVGIVGGVGPHASLHFYQRFLQLSPAGLDEEYPTAVLVAEKVPSRIDHLLGRGPSPLPALLETVRKLERAGVDTIVIPSATTHAYWEPLAAATSVPLGHLLVETGKELRRERLSRPLILATAASVALRSFEPHLPPGCGAVYPAAFDQDTVNDLIDRVKRGDSFSTLRDQFTAWLRTLICDGNLAPDCVVLGCTELSVIAPRAPLPLPVVDVTDVLVRSVLPAPAPISHVTGRR